MKEVMKALLGKWLKRTVFQCQSFKTAWINLKLKAEMKNRIVIKFYFQESRRNCKEKLWYSRSKHHT